MIALAIFFVVGACAAIGAFYRYHRGWRGNPYLTNAELLTLGCLEGAVTGAFVVPVSIALALWGVST